LDIEKLSEILARLVLRQEQRTEDRACGTCFPESLDLAFFFGLPVSLNNINVLHRSHILARLAKGDAQACNYTVNGRQYTMGYYLADGIYPD
jgi:hypothetical protein